MTTIAISISGFSFQIANKTDDGYFVTIERAYPWETVVAYGTLKQSGNSWVLDGMTFEHAHQEVMLQDFFRELMKVRVQAYPEVVACYEKQQQQIFSQLKPAI